MNRAEDRSPAALLDGLDLVVVSNRQPYTFGYDEHGGIEADRPAGGLTAGLDPALRRTGGTWIAWGAGEADGEATDEDGRVRVPPEDPSYTLELLDLSEAEVDSYYNGYSNQVLWPLCHGGIWQTVYNSADWDVYRRVNRRFADAAAARADEGTLVWFHDYHLARAPAFVREAAPGAFLLHFWHITWPGWETFRGLPNHETILRGLLANDLLGFHTDRYVTDFLDCVDRAIDGASVDGATGTVRYDDRSVAVKSFPLGVDAPGIERLAESFDAEGLARLAERHGVPTTGQVALGVDRLDYTKGIPERIEALERYLERWPERRGKLTLVQKEVESRSSIPNYQELQAEVDEAIDRVNDRFGTPDWQPVVRIEEFVPREELIGLYRLADVMLVSPLRDGMNLVAKEYVAARVDGDGVLVLSDQAGTHEQLGDDAVTINPLDVESFAGAIDTAVTMPPAERRQRMRRLRDQVVESDLDSWLRAVLAAAVDRRGASIATVDG